MSEAGAHLLFLAEQLGAQLRERHYVLVSAESCTAGGVAYAVTQVPGSSAWFDRALVVYSNQAKHDLLGVPPLVLRDYGAVSEPVARAMARGALQHTTAHAALAVTGIAGPGGGSKQKPVGLVYFAAASRDGRRIARSRRYGAIGRARVRSCSVAEALALLEMLANEAH